MSWTRIRVRELEQVSEGDRIPTRSSRGGWDRPTEQGNIRFQARTGYRAAVFNLGDGLYVVGEVPESSTREIGFLPLLAPLLVKESMKRLARRQPSGRGESALAWVRNAATKAGQRVTGRTVQMGGDLLRAVAAPEWASEEILNELGYCTCQLRRP